MNVKMSIEKKNSYYEKTSITSSRTAYLRLWLIQNAFLPMVQIFKEYKWIRILLVSHDSLSVALSSTFLRVTL